MSNLPIPSLPRKGRLIGVIKDFQKDPLEFQTQAVHEYGHVVNLPIFPVFKWVMLSHPEAVEQVLVKNHKNYIKGPVFSRPVSLLAGQSILTTEGPEWQKGRKLVTPAFSRPSLVAYGPEITRAIEQTLSEFRLKSESFDLNASLTKLTLRIIGKLLFGLQTDQDAEQISLAIREGMAYVNHKMNVDPLTPPWWPNQKNRQFKFHKKKLDAILERMIRERGQTDGDNLLKVLMKSAEEDKALSPKRLMDEILTLLVAGHDTTSAWLSWAFYLLAKNPEVKIKLLEEVRGVLNGQTATLGDIDRLTYTKLVLDETNRLYPPAWGMPRTALDEDIIQGYTIPKGCVLTLSQWVTHRHPDFWPDPLKFIPERFEESEVKKRHRFSYYPFGAGPRVCVGSHLASMEAVLILASLIQAFDFEVLNLDQIKPDPTFTLLPNPGLQVKLRPY